MFESNISYYSRNYSSIRSAPKLSTKGTLFSIPYLSYSNATKIISKLLKFVINTKTGELYLIQYSGRNCKKKKKKKKKNNSCALPTLDYEFIKLTMMSATTFLVVYMYM